MKSLFFAIASLVTASAFAKPGADIYMTRMECKTVKNYADNSTTIKVLEGGLSGIPQLEVTRSTIAGAFTDRYLVKNVPSDRVGAPQVYEAPGIRFSVNLTVAPTNGTYPATLATQASTKEAPVFQAFACTLIK